MLTSWIGDVVCEAEAAAAAADWRAEARSVSAVLLDCWFWYCGSVSDDIVCPD